MFLFFSRLDVGAPLIEHFFKPFKYRLECPIPEHKFRINDLI